VGASCLIRINPENGKEIMRLRLPVNKPTACTFGELLLDDASYCGATAAL
jgi:sugar lactone lactonase YvrE